MTYNSVKMAGVPGASSAAGTTSNEPLMRALITLTGLLGLLGCAYLAAVAWGWLPLVPCLGGNCISPFLEDFWIGWFGLLPVPALGVIPYFVMLVAPSLAGPHAGERRRRAAWSALMIAAVGVLGGGIWMIVLQQSLKHPCDHCVWMHCVGVIAAAFVAMAAPIGPKEAAVISWRRGLLMVLIGMVLVGVMMLGQWTHVQMARAVKAPAAEGRSVPGGEGPQLPADRAGEQASVHDHDHDHANGEHDHDGDHDHEHGDDHDHEHGEPGHETVGDGGLPATAAQPVTESAAVCANRVLREHADDPRVRIAPSGLQYMILEAGGGQAIQANDTVSLHVQGKVASGALMIDTRTSGEPMTLHVGDQHDGLREALTRMKVGARWSVVVPPYLVRGPNIPAEASPDDALIYDLEVLDRQERP